MVNAFVFCLRELILTQVHGGTYLFPLEALLCYLLHSSSMIHHTLLFMNGVTYGVWATDSSAEMLPLH